MATMVGTSSVRLVVAPASAAGGAPVPAACARSAASSSGSTSSSRPARPARAASARQSHARALTTAGGRAASHRSTVTSSLRHSSLEKWSSTSRAAGPGQRAAVHRRRALGCLWPQAGRPGRPERDRRRGDRRRSGARRAVRASAAAARPPADRPGPLSGSDLQRHRGDPDLELRGHVRGLLLHRPVPAARPRALPGAGRAVDGARRARRPRQLAAGPSAAAVGYPDRADGRRLARLRGRLRGPHAGAGRWASRRRRRIGAHRARRRPHRHPGERGHRRRRPPERAGAAAAISQGSVDLSGSLGMAVIGSVAVAVYRSAMVGVSPAGLSTDAVEAARSTLGGAVAASRDLPAGAGVCCWRPPAARSATATWRSR